MEVELEGFFVGVEGDVEDAGGIATRPADVAAGGVDEDVDFAPAGEELVAGFLELRLVEGVSDEGYGLGACLAELLGFGFGLIATEQIEPGIAALSRLLRA